jgi:Fanconi-associated nuclease 1
MMVERTPNLRWVLARMLHDGTALLEKQKKYAEAAACLRLLLSTPFCPGKRGHWWNRLSLNVEHMGHKKHSLILAETALSRDNHSLLLCDQLILQKRVLKLAKPPLRWTRPSFLSPSSAFSIASLKKPRTSTIYGRLVREQVRSAHRTPQAFLYLPDQLLFTGKVREKIDVHWL